MDLKVGKCRTLKETQSHVSYFRSLSIKPKLVLQHLLQQRNSCRRPCERRTVLAGINFLVA